MLHGELEMLEHRIEIIKRIELLRGRPLISYVTSIRPNMSASMAGDAITPIIEQIEQIPSDEDKVDLLIISNGGDPITSLRIVNLLRERFKKVSVLVPYVAYSASTVLALGADEILMHPYSNLGPVDPQLTVTRNNENGIRENLSFSSEDLRNFIEFVKSDVGISDQEHLVQVIHPLIKEVGALSIGSAKRSQQLSLTLSEKMLSYHVKDSNKAKTIAQALNSSYYNHGYAVGRTEAKRIGLPVINPDPELEKLMWELWKDYSDEMKCDLPFEPVREILNDEEAKKKVMEVPIVNLPGNTPPDAAQAIIVQIAKNTPVSTRKALATKSMVAAIESSRLAKAVYCETDLLYWRNPDMSLGINCTQSDSGWVINESVQKDEPTDKYK